MEIEAFHTVIIVLVGLIIGSFSNALIYRLPRRIKLTEPKRSVCPQCGHEIAWYDNLPVLSWVLLRGKCRHCGASIGVRYPLVEIINGLIAFTCLQYFGFTPTWILAFGFCSILITITVIDLEHMIIPDKINKPGVLIGLIVGAINQFYPTFALPFSQSILSSVIGFVIGYGSLFLLWWVYFKLLKVSALGGGDIKFMGFVGALFGPASILPTVLGGSIAGIFGAVIAIIKSKGNVRVEFPFGPWLALGAALYLFGIDVSLLISKLLLSIGMGVQ